MYINPNVIVAGERIMSGSNECFLDYALATNSTLLQASFYRREQEVVKAVGAGTMLGTQLKIYGNGRGYDLWPLHECNYNAFYQKLGEAEKDSFTQCTVSISAEDSKFIVCESGNEGDAFYDFLMKEFDLPLLREWGPALFGCFREEFPNMKGELVIYGDTNVGEREMPLNGRAVKLKDIRAYRLPYKPEYFEERLKKLVTKLLQNGAIRIGNKPQKKFSFENLDDYIKIHGSSLVENLEKKIEPLSPLNGQANNFTLLTKPLYPQQLAMVNGAVALLNGVGRNKKERKQTESSYCLLTEGMGTGKTVQAASIMEACEVDKAMRRTHKSLEEIYDINDTSVNYRAIVMCPGHLVRKWKREIEGEVPYSKVEIIDDFSDLVKIRERGRERNGREFYVISKDFAKLSYQERPAVTHFKTDTWYYRDCEKCGEINVTTPQCKCGSTKFRLRPMHRERISGMCCPSCGHVVGPYKIIKWDGHNGLYSSDFAAKNSTNSNCIWCGASLWEPNVRNLKMFGSESSKERPWKRRTYYANASRKGTKTIWVHDRWASERGEALNIIICDGCRKVAPCSYIKKHLKGFFDYAVFDEVHTLKSGTSAQGIAMHALIKASKKQLALTGTIAGGYADHLFYLIYRLDPNRMRKSGFTWEGRQSFIEKYGSLVTNYEVTEGYDNKASRGRQISSPKCKPGISPCIFTDFLLDKALFLDISDMSKYLPPLKEEVVLVKHDSRVLDSYRSVIDTLKHAMSSDGYGMTLASAMLQFSLSYLDKPYGREPIMSPIHEDRKVTDIPCYDQYKDSLLPKEEKLLELVSEELSQNRNVFIYAEYTGSDETRISERLRDILEQKIPELKEKVFILDSEKVDAADREDWILDVSRKGAKVVITNPRCVETGLDFVFMDKETGVLYNYPTIIFTQVGYSAFTISQASRRAYRLNQRQNCRTVYLAYEDSAQAAVLEILGKKMSATAAIQGKFSSEGLSAMANGVDTRVELARMLSSNDMKTTNDLQAMFDVVKAQDDDRFKDTERMKLFSEIVKNVSVSIDQDIFEFENTFITEAAAEAEIMTDDSPVFDEFALFDLLDDAFSSDAPVCAVTSVTTNTVWEPSTDPEEPAVIKKHRKKTFVVAGQTSFSFC